MPPILLGEYRNQHSNRKYPFADDAALLDTEGRPLPVDFLVDAFLYPIDLVGAPYISQMDVHTQRLTISDTGGGIIGYAALIDGATQAEVYESGPYQRQIGILIYGAGLGEIFRGRPPRNFVPAATALCPTTYIPLNQEGVRGILLPNGVLLTGDVVFEGRDGIVASSYILPDGRNVLEFGAYGVPPTTPEDCGDDCLPIKEICFIRMPNSRFMISEYAPNVLALTSHGFDLEDLCERQRSIRLPGNGGVLPPRARIIPCEDPPIPPLPPDPGPRVEICMRPSAGAGNLFIVTPSAADFLNAIGVSELDHVGVVAQPALRMPTTVENTADALRYVNDFTDPVTFADGLVIFVRGLANYRSAQ